MIQVIEPATEAVLDEMPVRADILMPITADHRILRVEFRG